jgi:hypothetical protein
MLATIFCPSGIVQGPICSVGAFTCRNVVSMTGRGAQDLKDGGVQQFFGSGIEIGDETVKQLRMSLQPLDGPGKCGGRCFVVGREHGDQFVGDLVASHRRTVLVAALQHQGQHIITLTEAGVGQGLVNEPINDHGVVAAVLVEPAPRTPPSPIPLRHRKQRELRAEFDSRRKQFTQSLQFFTIGTEHRAQYDVERDPHHRGHRREGLTFRPCRELVTATRSMISSYAASRRPLNDGVSSLRRVRCRSPSSANIEFGPMTRPRLASVVSAICGAALNN